MNTLTTSRKNNKKFTTSTNRRNIQRFRQREQKRKHERELTLQFISNVTQYSDNGILCNKLLNYKGDEEIVYAVIKSTTTIYNLHNKLQEWASIQMKNGLGNNRAFVKKLIDTNLWKANYVCTSSELRYDFDIVMMAVQQNTTCFRYLPSQFRENKDIILNAIKNTQTPYISYNIIPYIDKLLFANYEFMLLFIDANVNSFLYASDDLKNNHTIVTAACKKNGYMLEIASEKMKNTLSIVKNSVNFDTHVLKFASYDIRNNKQFVMENMTNEECKWKLQRPTMFEHVSTKLQDDYDVVMHAVKINGCALQFASEKMKNTMAIILAAIYSNPYAFKFVPFDVRNNKQIIMENIKNDSDATAFKFASTELQNDYDVVLCAVTNNGRVIRHANKRFFDNRKIILASLTNGRRFTNKINTCIYDDGIFRHTDDKLRNDPEMCVYAEIAIQNKCPNAKTNLNFSFFKGNSHSEKIKNYELLEKQMKIITKNKLYELFNFNIIFDFLDCDAREDILCPLTLLNNHGKHMTTFFKKSIRQFLCPENVFDYNFINVLEKIKYVNKFLNPV
jgi:hypothetical protein